MKRTTTDTCERENYRKALSYAYALNPKLYRDIVHDAYLHWFEKSKKNLFEEEEKRVIRVVKLTWMGYYRNRRSKEGKLKYRIAKNYMVDGQQLYEKTDPTTPEDHLIAKELEEHMIGSMTSDLQLEIYLYAVQGYRPIEIAEMVGKRKSTISYYFKKMAYSASLFN